MLARDHLDPVHVPLDRAGVPVRGEPGGDGGEVLAQALREGVEFSDLALLGLGEPALEAVAVAASQEGGKAAGEPAGRGNVSTARAEVLEALLGRLALVLRTGEEQAGGGQLNDDLTPGFPPIGVRGPGGCRSARSSADRRAAGATGATADSTGRHNTSSSEV